MPSTTPIGRRAGARRGASRRVAPGRESLSLDDTVALVTRARGERDRPRFGWESLTPTEHQVVDLIRRGSTNADVADRLLMGRETVKSHLSSIYRKLDVANRTELAALAATVEPLTD